MQEYYYNAEALGFPFLKNPKSITEEHVYQSDAIPRPISKNYSTKYIKVIHKKSGDVVYCTKDDFYKFFKQIEL